MIVIIIFASGILVGFILFLFKNHIFVKPNVVYVEECVNKHNSQDQQGPVSNSNNTHSEQANFLLIGWK